MPNMPLYIPKDIDKYFYNREKDIKKINYYIKSLNEGISQQLLITGFRGVGKTFLLKKIIKDLDTNILVSYIDISEIYGRDKGELKEESILLNLLEKMNESLLNHDNSLQQKVKILIQKMKIKDYDFKNAGTIFNIPIPDIVTDYNKLSKFVMEFPQNVVDSIEHIDGFLIVIDEFQLITKLENDDALFWLIRSFNQNQDNVSYIMTGSLSKTSSVIAKVNGESGAFGGRMIQINIEPFSKEETKSYLKDRMSEIRFTSDGFERFYRCTRGIPMYLNSFANLLSPNIIYDDLKIEEVFKINMDQILFMWIRLWSSLTDFEKAIIISFIDNNEIQIWSEILKNTSLNKSTLSKYLENLKNKGIIEYNKPYYSLADRMLKTWLLREKEINGFYPS